MKEFWGEEKADKIKENQSEAAKKRDIHGHTGHKHTEASKQIIREKTIALLGTQKHKVTKPQQTLYDAITFSFSSIKCELEYPSKYYVIDIALPDFKIAIEVDGDFWHCNESKGYLPIYNVQKNNLINDKNKNRYLNKKGWIVLRYYESDIYEKIDEIIKEITKKIMIRSVTNE